MGWAETSTGKYAFEFTSTSVTFYIDGWMGKEYKSEKKYNVISRKMVGIEDDLAIYKYIVSYNQEIATFIVSVVNKGEYNIAFIDLYEDFKENLYFDKLTTYGCSRKYK